jgi:hypothetical protein
VDLDAMREEKETAEEELASLRQEIMPFHYNELDLLKGINVADYVWLGTLFCILTFELFKLVIFYLLIGEQTGALGSFSFISDYGFLLGDTGTYLLFYFIYFLQSAKKLCLVFINVISGCFLCYARTGADTHAIQTYVAEQEGWTIVDEFTLVSNRPFMFVQNDRRKFCFLF